MNATAAPALVVLDDAFVEALASPHDVLVIVFSVVSVVTFIAMAVRWAVKGVRLATMMVPSAAVAVCALSFATWGVTYTGATKGINANMERTLRTTAHVIANVRSEFDSGTAPLGTMQSESWLMNATVDYAGHFPTPHNAMYALLKGYRAADRGLQPDVYVGLPDGRINLVSRRFQHMYVGLTDELGGEVLEGCVACPAFDRLSRAACREHAAGAGFCAGDQSRPPGAMECGGTCGAAAHAAFCAVGNYTSGLIRVQIGDGLAPSGRFPLCRELGRTPYEYNAVERPWYKYTERVVWHKPYVFADSKQIGVTATVGWRDVGTGGYHGVFAVDFRLESVRPLLRRVKPTQNSVVLLAMETEAELMLMSSSLDNAALIELTGVDITEKLVNIMQPRGANGTALKEMFQQGEAAAGRGGQGVIYNVAGDVHMYLPLTLKATQAGRSEPSRVVALVVVPHDDMFGAAERASLGALALSIIIGVVGVAAFVGVVHLTLRELHRLERDMQEVAYLKLDGLQKRPVSRVAEVASIGASFDGMVSELRQFKKFLPVGMFDRNVMLAPPTAHGDYATTPGTAAIVFTDIVSSTACWEATPAGMRDALLIHNAAIRECIRLYDGYEVKTVGDAFMVAFDGSDAAACLLRGCRFALGIQEALLEAEDWPESVLALRQCAEDLACGWRGLRIRVGVHAGAVDVEVHRRTQRRDYYGITVNRAAKLEEGTVAGSVAVAAEGVDLLEAEGSMGVLGDVQVIDGGEVSVGAAPMAFKILASGPLLPRLGDWAHFFLARAVGAKSATPAFSSIPRLNSATTSARSDAALPSRETSTDVCSIITHSSRASASDDTVGVVMHVDFGGRHLYMTADADLADPSLGGGADKSSASGDLDPAGRYTAMVADLHHTAHKHNGMIAAVVGTSATVVWGAGTETGLRQNRPQMLDLALHFQDAVRDTAAHLDIVTRRGICLGRIGYGPFGGGGRKFLNVTGTPPFVSRLLTVAAAELLAECLFVSMVGERVGGYAVVGADRQPFFRPVDVWRCGSGTHVVSEVRPDSCYTLMSDALPDRGWSGAWVEAVLRGDAAAVQELAEDPRCRGDKVLVRAAKLQSSGRHLFPEAILCLL